MPLERGTAWHLVRREQPQRWYQETGLGEESEAINESHPLDGLIAAHQAAMETEPEVAATHEHILNILQALASHEIKQRHALRLLGLQALGATDEPAQAALYRQAAADIRRLQQVEP